jgi:hypothetical protein
LKERERKGKGYPFGEFIFFIDIDLKILLDIHQLQLQSNTHTQGDTSVERENNRRGRGERESNTLTFCKKAASKSLVKNIPETPYSIVSQAPCTAKETRKYERSKGGGKRRRAETDSTTVLVKKISPARTEVDQMQSRKEIDFRIDIFEIERKA